MSHLHQHVSPYTYGSRWLLEGRSLLVPFNWVANPGTPIQDIDLDWIDNPLDDFWSFNNELSLVANRAVDRLIEDGVFGVLTNDTRIAMMINSDRKATYYILEHPDLFIRTSLKTSTFKGYRFQLVYSIPAYRALSGSVFVEATKVTENPKSSIPY
jgi:hypothetical protein